MSNAARELAVHMSHPGTEHWKSLGRMLGYLKGKNTKVIIIINPKVLKDVMFCDSDYAMDKETGNSFTGLVATIGGKILTRSSKTQRTVTLSSMEVECKALSSCAQEVKFFNMLLEEMNEVQ